MQSRDTLILKTIILCILISLPTLLIFDSSYPDYFMWYVNDITARITISILVFMLYKFSTEWILQHLVMYYYIWTLKNIVVVMLDYTEVDNYDIYTLYAYAYIITMLSIFSVRFKRFIREWKYNN